MFADANERSRVVAGQFCNVEKSAVDQEQMFIGEMRTSDNGPATVDEIADRRRQAPAEGVKSAGVLLLDDQEDVPVGERALELKQASVADRTLSKIGIVTADGREGALILASLGGVGRAHKRQHTSGFVANRFNRERSCKIVDD